MARCRYEKPELRVIAIVLAVAAVVFGGLIVAMCKGQEPSREVIVLCFSQPNCPTCVVQKPNWVAFKKAHPTFPVVDIDTSKQPNATRMWNVKTTPTTIFIRADKDGNSIEMSRRPGVVSNAEMVRLWREAIAPEMARVGREVQSETAKREFTPVK